MDLHRLEQRVVEAVNHPLWTLVRKEMTDHMKSFRFNILMGIILLTTLGSLYTALSTIRDAASSIEDADQWFLYLQMLTITEEEGTLYPFITFVSFLGPLLGIGMGFDAINSERNKNTLIRMMSQPIPRDSIILAKFLAALIIISVFIFFLGFLVIGLGLMFMGIPPSFGEFIRVTAYLVMIMIYISFWLSLSILFSIRFKQAATSALAGIAVWLFFTVFYTIIVNLIVNASMPDQLFQTVENQQQNQELLTSLMRISPNYLFSEITMVLLTPSFRPLGPISMEQMVGYVPSPLDLIQSLTMIWPQVMGILAAALVCFAISYLIFMRQEIRS